ncbi:MAG: sensor histidine kinase N-terminal domain-containing protein [Rubrivivax sp.]|nr:sensor histidine kinase N-terminal domain-containing protein [Rubrivivax sp.]
MNVKAIAMPQTWSLRQMLMVAMAGFTLMGWLAGGLITTHLAERTEAQLHEAELRQIGHLLLSLTEHELDELGPNADMKTRVQMAIADSVALGDTYRYQIWAESGELLLANFGVGQHAMLARFGQTGFTTTTMDGESWRVYNEFDSEHRRQIQIAERDESAFNIWSAVDWKIALIMLSSPVIVLWPASWVLNRLLRPIDAVARALERRSPDSLEPVPTRAVPREVAPMVYALNRLFERLDSALLRERTFTGVAAHEMRTPLAAVRVLAQVVRSADSVVERDDALDRLIVGTDRCAHLLDQLLTLQRLDAAAEHDLNETVDLTDVVMEIVDATRAEAQRREVQISVRLDGSSLRGHRFGILTLLRNLISNAIAYTPRGGRVEISTAQEGDRVCVTVDDSGIGIPQQDRERAFSRFERLGARTGTGVGLGLSIVQTVAAAHNGTISLDESPLGGLRVVVCFVGRSIGDPDDMLSVFPDGSSIMPDTLPLDTQPATIGGDSRP